MADIAHALSLLCRGNGHLPHFYSVAQHSLNCMKEAVARGYSERVQLGCLLHDASEAYLSDITRPIKGLLTNYLSIEKKLQDTIFDKWITPSLTEEERKQIALVDDALLYFEFLHMMNERMMTEEPMLKSIPDFSLVKFKMVEDSFNHSFRSLTEKERMAMKESMLITLQEKLERKIDEGTILVQKLLDQPMYHFKNLHPSDLPDGVAGVYIIYDKSSDEVLYIGRTKNIRRRIYTNHLMGPLANARLKKYLIEDENLSEICDLGTAKEYIRQNCAFQYITESDYRIRGQIEGLLGYVFDVRYIHEEH